MSRCRSQRFLTLEWFYARAEAWPGGRAELSNAIPASCILMAVDDSRMEAEPEELGRLPITHTACGGRADLVVLLGMSGLTYKVFCYRCEYTEQWTVNQTPKEKPG